MKDFSILKNIDIILAICKVDSRPGGHVYAEMNANIVSEYFMSDWAFRHFHILHV